jgi:aminoglycoside phosphotransferase family enzyme
MALLELPPPLSALLRPDVYPHPVESVRIVETHASWVLLTGTFAYKLKKPVNLGFLDFSTLAERERICREELRLNRRVAPDLYVGLVAITGTPQQPELHDDPPPADAGTPFEWAIRMREFPQEEQLDRLVASEELDEDQLGVLFEDFAVRTAQFHEAASSADAESPWSSPEALWKPVWENFIQIGPRVRPGWEQDSIARLRSWSVAERDRLRPECARRRSANRVRECHGDLHLSNLVRRDGQVQAFDCLEFDPGLRWCDVASDIGFLVMDLQLRGRDTTAFRFLTGYVEASGDYGALRVLRYYLVYRTMVRAKVAAISREQARDDRAAAEATQKLRRHVELGLSYVEAPHPLLVLMSGLSGSGKTWLSSRLGPRLGAVRVRSDVERKRLHGMDAQETSGSDVGTGIYDASSHAQTYARLGQCARDALEGGFSVLVDATFLRREQRAPFLSLAVDVGVPCLTVVCEAPPDVLRHRVAARRAAGRDASEAGLEVLAHQQKIQEPIDADRSCVIRVDTSGDVDIEALSRRALAAAGGG